MPQAPHPITSPGSRYFTQPPGVPTLAQTRQEQILRGISAMPKQSSYNTDEGSFARSGVAAVAGLALQARRAQKIESVLKHGL